MNKLPECLRPLMEQNHWVIWKWKDGKRPYQAHRPNILASTTDSTTWASYRKCASVSDQIGFVLRRTRIGALDLDDCRRGSVNEEWAEQLMDKARTYVEVTPSGKGLRIIGLANGPPVHRHVKMGQGKVEVYRDANRYITVTGDQVGDCKRLANVDWLIDKLAPARNDGAAVRIDRCDDDWRSICRRLNALCVMSMVRSHVPVGWRSDVIWKIAQSLRGKGATPGQVAEVLRASWCWRDKHGDNEGALRREVERVFRRDT